MSVKIVDDEVINKLRFRARFWYLGWMISAVLGVLAAYEAALLQAERETWQQFKELQQEQRKAVASFEEAWRDQRTVAETTLAYGNALKAFLESRTGPPWDGGRGYTKR